jgi:hypothetical protein
MPGTSPIVNACFSQYSAHHTHGLILQLSKQSKMESIQKAAHQAQVRIAVTTYACMQIMSWARLHSRLYHDVNSADQSTSAYSASLPARFLTRAYVLQEAARDAGNKISETGQNVANKASEAFTPAKDSTGATVEQVRSGTRNALDQHRRS